MNKLLLTDYITVNNFLNKDDCNYILKMIENNKWVTHAWADRDSNKAQSFYDNGDTSTELEVSFPFLNLEILLKKQISLALATYLSENGIPKNIIKSFSKIRLNKYNVNTNMKKHHDHIHTVFKSTESGIPILSVVGLLNDDYTGGEFVFFDDYEVKLKAGDILIFPSIFTYPHRVNTINSGTRYSFVSWAF